MSAPRSRVVPGATGPPHTGCRDETSVMKGAYHEKLGAVAQEYSKQGRLTLEADFERFHQLVRARGNNGG